MSFLSRVEEIMLIAIWKLQENAYGMKIREQIEKDTGVRSMFGAVYAPLNRLRKNGYVTAFEADGSADLGGRPRIYYKLSPRGIQKLREIKQLNESLWGELPELIEME